jgi:hypothetical protein
MTERPVVLRGRLAAAVAAAAGYPPPEGPEAEARLTLDPDHRAIPGLDAESRSIANELYLEDLDQLDPLDWEDEPDEWLLAAACAYHDRLLDGDGEGAHWGTARVMPNDRA